MTIFHYETRPDIDGPMFSNYDPESKYFRIGRLPEAYGFARALFVINGTDKQSFHFHCEDFNKLFHRWHDHKGTLFVYTAHSLFEQTQQMIERSWQSTGEDNEVIFLEPGDPEPFRASFHDGHKHVGWNGTFAVRPSKPDIDPWATLEFASKNCPSYAYCHGDVFMFRDEDDAMLFKMRF